MAQRLPLQIPPSYSSSQARRQGKHVVSPAWCVLKSILLSFSPLLIP